MRRYLVVLCAALLTAMLAVSPVGRPPAAQGLDGHVILAVGDMACDSSDANFNGGVGGSTRFAGQQGSDQMSPGASGDEARLGFGGYQDDFGGPPHHQG